MWRLLEENDTFQPEDEVWGDLSHEWRPIPEQWYGMSTEHKMSTTYGRFNMQVRRKISEFKDSNAVSSLRTPDKSGSLEPNGQRTKCRVKPVRSRGQSLTRRSLTVSESKKPMRSKRTNRQAVR